MHAWYTCGCMRVRIACRYVLSYITQCALEEWRDPRGVVVTWSHGHMVTCTATARGVGTWSLVITAMHTRRRPTLSGNVHHLTTRSTAPAVTTGL